MIIPTLLTCYLLPFAIRKKLLHFCIYSGILFCSTDDEEFWSLLSHTDVLILRQFLNSDYTVLPIEVTGLKYHQQLRLVQLVKKAQRANLLPLKVRELKDTVPFPHDKTYGVYDHTKYNTYYDDWDELY